MIRRVTQFALLVPDYDEALSFYVGTLGFTLVEDTNLGDGKRWVRVRPAGSYDGPCILLARATNERQRSSVGNQTGGRVFAFLETDDLRRDHARLVDRGVRFVRDPADAPYGAVAVFEDPYGNLFDLIEPRATSVPPVP